MHVSSVPVVHVFHVNVLHLGLELLHDVSAAVVHILVVGSELLAQFVQLGTIGRHEAAIGGAGDEVGSGHGEVILQGVIVHGLHAYQGEIGDFFIQVFVGVHDVSSIGHQVGNAGVIGGGQHILQGIHEVVGGHFGHGVALVVVPLHALAQVEGPGQLILGHFPALGQAGDDLGDAVVLHQGINHVGTNGLVPGVAAGEVVQGGNFAGVQGSVHTIVTLVGLVCEENASDGSNSYDRNDSHQNDDLFVGLLLGTHFGNLLTLFYRILRRINAGNTMLLCNFALNMDRIPFHAFNVKAGIAFFLYISCIF